MKVGLVFNLFLSFLKVLRPSDTKWISCLNHHLSCTMWDEVYVLLTVAASFVYCALLDKNILEIIGKERMVQLNVELNLGSLTQFRTRAEQTADRRCDHALFSNSISLPGRLLAVVENKIKFPRSWRKWRANTDAVQWVSLLYSSADCCPLNIQSERQECGGTFDLV